MSNVRPYQCAVWFMARSRAAVSGVQMPANATAPAQLHSAAIVNGCKPKFSPLRIKKNCLPYFHSSPWMRRPDQGGFRVQTSPWGATSPATGSEWHWWPFMTLPAPDLCLPPPQGCILTAQQLLAPAQAPGGHFCAKLKFFYSGDMSALPCWKLFQAGQAHGMSCCWESSQRQEVYGEGCTTGRVKATSNRIFLALSW